MNELAQNPDLPRLLRCPKCHEALCDEPALLRCGGCQTTYPIVNGIPRLAGEPYVGSFGRQWNRYNVIRPEEDEAVLRAKTGWDPDQMVGRLVLDAGCGGGRYSRLLGERGCRVIGVDLSTAVEAAARHCAGVAGVSIVQGDLLRLPLAEGVFDDVFSIGVLHHTPDPRAAFAQVARRVKPGGRLAVWLYRRNTWPQEFVNSALRAGTTRLPAPWLERGCAALGLLGGVPLVNRTLNKIANFSNHPDWTLRVCDNFDWYAPRYQSHHTTEELKRWFEEEGFTDLDELPPVRRGRLYDWSYRHDLIIGSGVNVAGTRCG